MAALKTEASLGHTALPEVTTTTDSARILTSDDYFKVVQHENPRPAFWKFQDVMQVLTDLGRNPIVEAERRFCTTVNDDCGDLVGATPFCFIGWQLIHPGEHVPPHRHSSMAIYHMLQGRGYTVVEGVKYRWEKGDTLSCPAWAYHEHVAEGDEDTIMYVVQDMPMLAAQRTLFWEEPLGPENLRHMVRGDSGGSWSATRVDEA